MSENEEAGDGLTPDDAVKIEADVLRDLAGSLAEEPEHVPPRHEDHFAEEEQSIQAAVDVVDEDDVPPGDVSGASGQGDDVPDAKRQIPPAQERERVRTKHTPAPSINIAALNWIYSVHPRISRLLTKHKPDPLPLLLLHVGRGISAIKKTRPERLTQLNFRHPAIKLYWLLTEVEQSIWFEQLPIDLHTLDEWGVFAPGGRAKLLDYLAHFVWQYLPGDKVPDTILNSRYDIASVRVTMGSIAKELQFFFAHWAKDAQDIENGMVTSSFGSAGSNLGDVGDDNRATDGRPVVGSASRDDEQSVQPPHCVEVDFDTYAEDEAKSSAS